MVLWFDTEDYLEPAADDAALRLAKDLTAEGVGATFKVVGEKARVLEKRGRRDVIQALSRHAIGYHSNWHSVHPTPAEYLVRLGFLEGAEEFERREAAGVADVKRIFGVQPVCYGQPGSSWGPQSNPALRKLGIPMYLDEGTQVGLDEQPFWYGGLLYIFQMGRNQFRAQLNAGTEDAAANKRFDEAAARLASAGGGVISIYYHPTEFVTTEFWDGVNFARGANPEPQAWVKPHRRTPEDSERCYRVLQSFVRHMKSQPGVRFVTARDLLGLYQSPAPKAVDPKAVAAHLGGRSCSVKFRARCYRRRTCCWRYGNCLRRPWMARWRKGPPPTPGPPCRLPRSAGRRTTQRISSAAFTACLTKCSSARRHLPSPISRPPWREASTGAIRSKWCGAASGSTGISRPRGANHSTG